MSTCEWLVRDAFQSSSRGLKTKGGSFTGTGPKAAQIYRQIVLFRRFRTKDAVSSPQYLISIRKSIEMVGVKSSAG